MTSEVGVEHRFLFHCPCGAKIVTSRKTLTCSDCGKSMGVRRVRTRRQRRNSSSRSRTIWLLPLYLVLLAFLGVAVAPISAQLSTLCERATMQDSPYHYERHDTSSRRSG
jgi:hypothetical protein